ncbi:MAG: pentapeptide repeat-containing protein [Lachnospiraceae bacterium]|nr:pentapeptide repeat-containing protein [Lachnospiraceae bacterium]
MGETYIQRFEQEIYPGIFSCTAEETADAFDQERDRITKVWKGILRQYMEQLVSIQEEGKAPPVAEIDMSFLYTSLAEGHPKYRIDSYGEGGRVLGDSILTGYIPADWMAAGLENFTQRLSACAAEKSLRRYIRPAMIETLRLRAARSLLYYFALRFKYYIQDMLDLKILARVGKAPHFFIQIGEYMDWQKTIYAVRPSVDIFNCDRTEDLRFRSFPAVFYKDKVLKDLNLSHSSFKDSAFTDSSIQGCTMTDCVFEGCTFENVKVDAVRMAGCIFADCIFRETVFTGTVFFEEETDRENPQYFEPAGFHSCCFDGVVLEGCVLTGCPVRNCDAPGLVIDRDTRMEYSGFEKLVQGPGEPGSEEEQDGVL